MGNMRAAELRLVEPVPIEDELCTGVAVIEDLGFGARYVIYNAQTLYETGERVCVVKRKLVFPWDGITAGHDLTAQFMECRQKPAGILRRVT
jgi:hypothetical protein